MRKHWGWIVIVIITIGGGLVLYQGHRTASTAPVNGQTSAAAGSSNGAVEVNPSSVTANNISDGSAKKTDSGSETAPGTSHSPPELNDAPDLPAATVLENMRSAIRLYSSTFGGNPVGTNPEITSALNGNNPKQTHFFQSDSGLRINGQGESIDNWDTPFFFHQISGTEMEIRSGGPDRKLWTTDDLVTR